MKFLPLIFISSVGAASTRGLGMNKAKNPAPKPVSKPVSQPVSPPAPKVVYPAIQLGPRPYYLVDEMTDSPLKTQLQACSNITTFAKSRLSIGHRGGSPVQFPEHSAESHKAGFRMGIDLTECDVTFTMDGELVCRHDQCDLHTTTNIVTTALNAKCTKPFQPAEFNATGSRTKSASALCCTSDLTLAEFLTLEAKMDNSFASAKTPQEYLGGGAAWRTEWYNTGATLLTHKSYLALVQSLGGRFTPELKGRNTAGKLQIEDVFGSQGAYAQKLADEYKAAGINPKHVWLQSFNYSDVIYWIQNEPEFGKQAAFLDSANVPGDEPSLATLQKYAADGVKIWAPPTWVLVAVENGKIVPSQAAKDWKASGIPTLITWTLERSGRIAQEVIPSKSYYFQTIIPALKTDGDFYTFLDVLVKQVGIYGVFTDWAAPVTYYANCMGIGLNEFFPPYN